ncbi:MAG: nitrous oxide reductase family maturation protein NosD, partial [Promethearchaeota archaeon]
DLPGSLTNWTWAKNQGYCTGEGTISDPYVIAEYFFNTSTNADNCLNILHSNKPFIIEDCLFKGHSNFAGVRLTNTTNGLLRRNELYQYTGALFWIYNSSLNEISTNIASEGSFYGILIDGLMGLCHSNLIINNFVSYNIEAGIQLRGLSISNQIIGNTIQNNSEGIDLWSLANNNTIHSNMIRNNTNYGIGIDSDYNIIHHNCFIDNALHALDDGLDNNWDYNSRGNYWDNYTGSDNNGDGIGDAPHDITGLAGSTDNYPLMSCPLITAPGGIPGYNLILLVITGTVMIIGMIYLSLRKTATLNSRKLSS